MKTIYVTTIHVHEVPLSLVANDGGDYDNLELDPDDRGELMFARRYAGVQPFAYQAGAMPEEWSSEEDYPIVGISLTELSQREEL